MKKVKTAVITVLLMLLTACEPISQELPEKAVTGQILSEKSGDAEESDNSGDTSEENVKYTEYVAEVPEIINEETEMRIEAEECHLKGSLYKSDERNGFSGEGYVTGFYGGSADYLDITVKPDVNQHYDITICAAADSDVKNSIKVNDDKLQEFSLKGDGNFTKITFHGIFMQKGDNIISIKSGSSNFDLDYIEITDNDTVYDTNYELSEMPVSENTSDETAILLKTMKANFGKKILTGQYVSGDDNVELELIHKLTGKYPAIRFSDIGGRIQAQSEVESALKWAEKGGIVGFMWYWISPDNDSPGVYSKKSDLNLSSDIPKTDFSLKAAMTKEDIALLPVSEIEKLYKQGIITLECFDIIKDIDAVSNSLLVLADEKIPVLWRPLHEAGGGWYWWGADGADAYKWLYTLMYERMTGYHKLDNLIWIWNGQSKEYMVDDDMYDIAAVDIYLSPEKKFGSRSEQYQWLKDLTDSGKLLAMSECSSLPVIDEMLRDNSLWSFFGLWYGEHLMDSKGEFSDIYTKKEDFIKMYNAENAITLETLAGEQ